MALCLQPTYVGKQDSRQGGRRRRSLITARALNGRAYQTARLPDAPAGRAAAQGGAARLHSGQATVSAARTPANR